MDCIDCAVCVPECPVEAIFAEDDVPAEQADSTAPNADLAKTWPPITRGKTPLYGADAWARAKFQRAELKR